MGFEGFKKGGGAGGSTDEEEKKTDGFRNRAGSYDGTRDPDEEGDDEPAREPGGADRFRDDSGGSDSSNDDESEQPPAGTGPRGSAYGRGPDGGGGGGGDDDSNDAESTDDPCNPYTGRGCDTTNPSARPALTDASGPTGPLSRGDTRDVSAKVENTGGDPADVTVFWTLGPTGRVATAEATVRAGQSQTLTESFSWSDAAALGEQGSRTLSADLVSNRPVWAGESREIGTVTVRNVPGADDGDGDDGGGLSLPDSLGILPAVGPLSSTQTTLAAVGLIALVVVRA